VESSSFFSKKTINLATQITLFRVAVVPFIIILLSFPNRITCSIACFLFIIASISDFLDGYVARNSGLVTSLGKFLDPLADKLLICSILIQLSALGWIPAWISIVIIARELAITGLRAVAADNNIVMAADKYGKLKTGFQIAAIIPLTLNYPFFGIPFHELGILILYVAVFFTLFSGANYIRSFFSLTKEKKVS